MAEFVQAQCLHILYISSAGSVCAAVFVYVREDSPLRRLHNLTKGGAGALGALGTGEEQSRHICTKTVCASHSKNMGACVTGQTIHRHSRTLFTFSAMSYVKAIEVTVWAKKNRAENLRNRNSSEDMKQNHPNQQDTKHGWGGHEWTNAAEDRISLFPFTSLCPSPCHPLSRFSLSAEDTPSCLPPPRRQPLPSISLSVHPLLSLSS